MTRKQKNPRKSKSCTECRKMKKKCEGGVPGCRPCLERGVSHLCCWGDERDSHGRGRSAQSNAATVDNTTPIDYSSAVPISSNINIARIELMNVLAEEDAQASRNTDIPDVESSTHARQEMESWRLPTYVQAKELLNQHKAHLSLSGLHTVDYEAIQAAYDPITGVICKEIKYDVIALLLFVCASALSVIPATYAIAIGLVRRSEDLEELGDTWLNAGRKALDESDQYTAPTLEGVQAIIVYQYNLYDRGSRYCVVNSLDQGIRVARQLGLDRLGSHDSDVQIWSREGDSILKEAQDRTTGWWAAKTLRLRDWKAREFGRCQWILLLSRDWAATRQMGTYSIHPNSFTTQPPKVYLQKPSCSNERTEAWPYLLEGAKVLRCFGDICLDAKTQSFNGNFSYETILSLDAQIVALLGKRPLWMRAEDEGVDTSGIVLVDAANNTTNSPSIAAFLSCTLWQRLFVIHRPFLALSISDPERYGLSAQRTFDNAMLYLKTCKKQVAEGMYSINQSILMIQLHQAALVIITHLLLLNLNERICGSDQSINYKTRSASETVEIHKYLNFAITTLKTSRKATSSDNRIKVRKMVFEGVGERLESLLAACANLGNAPTITSKAAQKESLPATQSTDQVPDQLAQLDARLQQMSELDSWPQNDIDAQSDWLTMSDVNWQQVLNNLSW